MVDIYLKDTPVASFRQDNRSYLIAYQNLEIENYIVKNPHFKIIGRRMIESFKISLKNQTIKELPLELTRTW